MSNTEIIYLCNCTTHGIAVSRIEYPDSVDVELSVWTLGRHGQCQCWSCRLRHIWYIIKHGNPWPDDWVSMGSETAKELAGKIMEAAEHET